MADLLKKISKGVKASISVVKESVASPESIKVYKETWKGAKQLTKEGAMIKGRHKKAMKAHMKGKILSLNYPSVFEPEYVTRTIRKARRRKKKKHQRQAAWRRPFVPSTTSLKTPAGSCFFTETVSTGQGAKSSSSGKFGQSAKRRNSRRSGQVTLTNV